MRFRFWLGLIALALAGTFGVSAEAEPRIALVIGNAHYAEKIGALTTPNNDARLIAETLKKVGFVVMVALDADQKQMKRAIADFGDKLSDAGSTATGLFFYTGHGISMDSQSYLIPIDAQIEKASDVSIESITAADVLEQMEFSAIGTGIVIIDASRTNPLQKALRSSARGIGFPDVTLPNYLIAYSTAPGTLAKDGQQKNSPYAAALAEVMLEPGLSIHDVFDHTRKKVIAVTEQRQVPWESASMTGPFYFLPKN